MPGLLELTEAVAEAVTDLTPAQATAYHDLVTAVTDDPPVDGVVGLDAPLLAVTVVWDALAELLTAILPGDVGGALVQTGHRLVVTRSLEPQRGLRTVAKVTGIESRRVSSFITLGTRTTSADGDVLNEQRWTLLAPGHALGCSTGTVERPRTVRPADGWIRSIDWVAEGDLPMRYADAGRDDMPLHTDDTFARSLGFDGIIVQGLCTLARTVSAALVASGADDAAITAVSARFARPLYPGRRVRTDVDTQVDRRHRGVRFRAVVAEQTIVDGSLELAAPEKRP